MLVVVTVPDNITVADPPLTGIEFKLTVIVRLLIGVVIELPTLTVTSSALSVADSEVIPYGLSAVITNVLDGNTGVNLAGLVNNKVSLDIVVFGTLFIIRIL